MDLLPVAAGTRDRFAEGKREIQSSASCWFMCRDTELGVLLVHVPILHKKIDVVPYLFNDVLDVCHG